MCTFTWLAARRGYDVFLNHDEPAASGPESSSQGKDARGADWLCPFRSELGTWLLATSRGLTFALLADFSPPTPEPAPVDLLAPPGPDPFAAARALAEIGPLLESHALVRTRPFVLVAVHHPPGARSAMARAWSWDRVRLAVSDLDSPELLITSSMTTAGTEAARRQSYEQMIIEADYGPEPRHLVALHHLRDPAAPSGSFLSANGEARTRSFSRVRVRPSGLVARHEPLYPRPEPVRTASLSLIIAENAVPVVKK